MVTRQTGGWSGADSDSWLTPPTRRKADVPDLLVDMCPPELAEKQSTLFPRTQLLDALGLVTARRDKRNALLVGHAGVGKSSLVRALAYARHVQGGAKVFQLMLGSVMAGTSHRGDLEERLTSAITMVAHSKERVILFIDEAHQLVSSGSVEGGLGLADLMLPGLGAGELSVIGATTPAEFDKYFADSGPLLRRFEVLSVPEPSASEALEMLRYSQSAYEQFHGVTFTEAALRAAVRPFPASAPHQRLPDRAFTVIDTAGAMVAARGEHGAAVAGADIDRARKVLAEWNGKLGLARRVRNLARLPRTSS